MLNYYINEMCLVIKKYVKMLELYRYKADKINFREDNNLWNHLEIVV